MAHALGVAPAPRSTRSDPHHGACGLARTDGRTRPSPIPSHPSHHHPQASTEEERTTLIKHALLHWMMHKQVVTPERTVVQVYKLIEANLAPLGA